MSDPIADKAEDLGLQLADMSSELDEMKQQLAEANRRVAIMTLVRDGAKMDELALKLATDVEDIFVRGWDNVTQRRAVIQIAARVLIETALAGGKPAET